MVNPYLLALLAGGLGTEAGFAKAAYDNLRNNQKQMVNSNTVGSDNYFHRKGMCEIGQGGYNEALLGLVAGASKEGRDITCKSFGKCGEKKQNISDVLSDSYKDMKNNIEGLNLGLQNRDKSCKILLNNLDWKTNTWKK